MGESFFRREGSNVQRLVMLPFTLFFTFIILLLFIFINSPSDFLEKQLCRNTHEKTGVGGARDGKNR